MSRRATILLPSLLIMATSAGAQEPAGRYSESAALALSLAGTLVPIAVGVVQWSSQEDEFIGDGFVRSPERAGPAMVMAAGIIIGPAFGYWYSGQVGRGLKTVGLRSGFLLLSFIPAFAICGWDCSPGDSGYDIAWVVVATGAGLGAASAIWDIARIKGSVRKKNSQEQAAAVYLSPLWVQATKRPGIAISVRF